MSIIGLNLPNDVCWERVCVTNDMTDRRVCDTVLPPRWRSSIAVFRYVPEAEYQTHPGRKLIYYKVVCTVTGYQPQRDEVAGAINFEGFRTSEITDMDRRLESFLPCHGAAIQVAVAPSDPDVEVADYPYFSDFQPKQRLLYEQASDTNERASRSLESLNVKKGGGTTQSQEVLDIDGGYSVGGTVGASGVSAGLNYSHQQQRGTRNIGSNETTDVRTTDATREARETLSHTTQITQMYNLLQAYHLGTNRALFYLAPRPHVLEEPSGFIRGPRVIDGIQEFFLVVNQPEGAGDPCLSVRLDTAHITETSETDYERRDVTFPESAPLTKEVPAPSGPSAPGQRELTGAELRTIIGGAGDPRYQYFVRTLQNTAQFAVPDGFCLDPERAIEDLPNVQPNYGRRAQRLIEPSISSDGRAVTLTVEATSFGGVRYPNTSPGDAFEEVFGSPPPPTTLSSPAAASRQFRFHLRSLQRTRVTAERRRLLVTSRMLCCCDDEGLAASFAPRLTASFDLQGDLESSDDLLGGDSKGGASFPSLMTARQANHLSQLVAERTQRIVNTLPPDAHSIDTDFVIEKLAEGVLKSASWQRALQALVIDFDFMTESQVEALAFFLGKAPEELTLFDAAMAPAEELQRVTGLMGEAFIKLRLDLLRIPTRTPKGPPVGSPPVGSPPDDLPVPTDGLVGYWDAAEGVGVDNTDHATFWQDLSGHGHNATPGVSPPLVLLDGLDDRPVLRFSAGTGVASMVTPSGCVPATGMAPRTLCFVGEGFDPGGGADQLLFGYGTPAIGGFYVSDGATVGTTFVAPAFAVELGGSVRLDTEVPYTSDARVVVAVFDGANLTVRVNGAQVASSVPILTTDGVPSILWGGSWDCAAAAVYDRALDGADLAALEAAFAQRGGITLP